MFDVYLTCFLGHGPNIELCDCYMPFNVFCLYFGYLLMSFSFSCVFKPCYSVPTMILYILSVLKLYFTEPP